MSLIFLLSGRKQSGKTTASSYIAATWINQKYGSSFVKIDKAGRIRIGKTEEVAYDPEIAFKKQCVLFDEFSVKIYSFADYMKRILMDLFMIPPERLWGADKHKNMGSGVCWEAFALDIREQYAKPDTKRSQNLASGEMTCRELMEVFGSHVCRRMDDNCWSRATYSSIKADNKELAIITDGRFPNEVTMGAENGVKSIRLLRNPYNKDTLPEAALDNMPYAEFTHVLDNAVLSFGEKNKAISKILQPYLKTPVEESVKNYIELE
jgi:hypothetical protein